MKNFYTKGVEAKTFWFLLAIIVSLLYCNLYAQDVNEAKRTIKGKVTDTEGEAIIGAIIVDLGNTKNGTISDTDGTFSINVDANSTLRFTFLGFTPKEVKITNQTSLNVVLSENDKVLNEVVVIGYGEVKKKDLTGAVGEVKIADIQKAPVPSFDQALAGRVSGIQVTSNEGQPGTEAEIVIRGGNSLSQSNSPLFVIDGFPMEDFSMSLLNPEEIESISVLKDASSTAIYGSRGANGVIMIETKKGKIGVPSINYHGYVGFQTTTKKMDMMNPYEFVKYQLELYPDEMTQLYLTKPNMTLEDYKNSKNIDWQSLMFRDALVHNHDLSIRGATDNTKYSFSGSFVDQDGLIINSGFKRTQGRMSVEQRITPKLKANANINYSEGLNYGSLASEMKSTSNSYASYLMYRTLGYRPVSNEGDIVNELIDPEDENALFLLNPVLSTKNEIRQEKKTDLLMNFGLTYDFSKELVLNIRGGYNKRAVKGEALNNSQTYKGITSSWNLKGVNGTYSNTEMDNWVNENNLVYKKRINKDHYFDVMGAFTMQGSTYSKYGFESINIPNEELGLRSLHYGKPNEISVLLSKEALVSFLGRVNYNLKSKYLFTASLRSDGSSKFEKSNRWGVFPSGAIAWHMGQEKFMNNLRFVNGSKLRLSYGITGNNRIANFANYQKITLTDYYSFGNEEPVYAAIMGNMGNKNLKWEETAQLDLGYDLSLFNNRIRLETDVYVKTTSNVLLNADVPLSTGSSKVYKNIGKIRNKGFELTLKTVNVQTKDFYWDSDFNISFNTNKIVELSEGQTNMLSWVAFTGDYNGSYSYIAEVGGPAASIYGYIWDGNYQYEDFDRLDNGTYQLKTGIVKNGNTTIQPGDIKYRDVNNDGIVNEKDMVVIGRGLPIHFGGFNNNFTYKGFSLNIFLQWSYGNDIINANRLVFEGNLSNRYNLNQFASYQNRWTPENPTNENFRVGGAGPKGRYSNKIVEDGSYLRLKTVQLGYAFPKKMRGPLKSLEVYCAAQNLYTWSNYSGYDPEVSVRNSTLTPGFDYSSYPRNLTVTFGVKSSF